MVSLKELVIRTLRLEDIVPADIIDEAALFGEGLGLDSIDALELVVAIEREYGVEIPDAEVGRRAFASILALADFVLETHLRSAVRVYRYGWHCNNQNRVYHSPNGENRLVGITVIPLATALQLVAKHPELELVRWQR